MNDGYMAAFDIIELKVKMYEVDIKFKYPIYYKIGKFNDK